MSRYLSVCVLLEYLWDLFTHSYFTLTAFSRTQTVLHSIELNYMYNPLCSSTFHHVQVCKKELSCHNYCAPKGPKKRPLATEYNMTLWKSHKWILVFLYSHRKKSSRSRHNPATVWRRYIAQCFSQVGNILAMVGGAAGDSCACRDSCSLVEAGVINVIFCSYNLQMIPFKPHMQTIGRHCNLTV